MPSQAPFGDIYSVETPALDQLGLRLYNEQRQREAIAQRETQDLDKQMQSELGKIRSADTPAFIDQYQKYKNIKKQLYNPKVQRNAKEINRINQEANVELSKAMQLATESVEFKERLKQINSERGRRPDYFNDDFQERYQAALGTPLSGLAKNQKYGDLSNFDNFYYKGNVTNLQPILDKAKGVLREVGTPEINEKFSPIEREITSYKGLNSPRQYYNNLVGSLRGARAQRDLLTSFDFTPEEEQRIADQYNKEVRDNPKYRNAYGADQLDFPESSDYSDTARMAKILAMEHGLQAIKTEKKRETKKQEAALQQQGFKQSNIRLNASLQGANRSQDNTPPPKDGEFYDLTERLQGVKITGLTTGQSFGIKPHTKILYHPGTKMVSYTDIDGNKKEKPLTEFKKDISTINTAQDLKIVDEVIRSIETPETKKKNEPTQVKKVIIKGL